MIFNIWHANWGCLFSVAVLGDIYLSIIRDSIYLLSTPYSQVLVIEKYILLTLWKLNKITLLQLD